MAKALPDRKVVDRTHPPHLLLQERYYTGVLLGLILAFYCPLCTHGCFQSCVKYFFGSRISECWYFHSFVSVTLVITINVMKYPQIGRFSHNNFSMVNGYNMNKNLECPIVFILLPGIGRARYCWLQSSIGAVDMHACLPLIIAALVIFFCVKFLWCVLTAKLSLQPNFLNLPYWIA